MCVTEMDGVLNKTELSRYYKTSIYPIYIKGRQRTNEEVRTFVKVTAANRIYIEYETS